MEIFFKILPFLLVITFFLLLQNITQQPRHIDNLITQEISEYIKTDHFEMYYAQQDQSIIQEMLQEGESFLKQLEKDFDHEIKTTIVYKVFPDLVSFHQAIGYPSAPAWIIGQDDENVHLIVSPQNPGPEHTQASIMRSYKVGLVTKIIYDKYQNHRTIPRWLHQGVALYKAEYFKAYNYAKKFGKNGKKITTLEQLECIGKKGLDQSQTFDEYHGFALSYSLVKFIDTTYGWNFILELLADYTKFEKIFSCSKEAFNKRWLTWLVQQPVSDKS